MRKAMSGQSLAPKYWIFITCCFSFWTPQKWTKIFLTPSWKQGLVFWLVHGMPLWQSSCMDPIWPEFEIWKIFHRRPAEILAPWTPGVSHGTKIFGSKIFSYHPQMMLFYAFWGFVMQKMLKIMKNCLFLALFPITKHLCKNGQFFMIFSIFCITNPQNA